MTAPIRRYQTIYHTSQLCVDMDDDDDDSDNDGGIGCGGDNSSCTNWDSRGDDAGDSMA